MVVPQANQLTDAQRRYIALERQHAEHVKPFLDKLQEAKEAVIAESGLTWPTDKTVFFQSEDGCVYAIEEAHYNTVKTYPFHIIHTRRAEFGEVKGDLSVKRATEAGFEPRGV